MQKVDVYHYLDSRNIWHEITEHEAVYSMGELSSVTLPYPEADAKNLFVRDDKKQKYYLITVKGDKRVDLKAFRQRNHTRPLSFAAPEELRMMLGLVPGSVSPFGLLHDEQGRVEFFLDRAFLEAPGLIGIHPNDNTATVWLKTADFIGLLEEAGHTAHLTEI
ncbi:MAG: prolyl-tRNA synthetase associated domain-containing protein [Clostridiales bacterium]|nr:prolyl-tRNA synthetase associated domain-containing protein [Clostridiales bacterium]